MATIKLKIAELRKEKGIGQQELAENLGVSFQSVSKWETGITMPDITLLPEISKYFDVTVDEILGLKPIKQQKYLKRATDDRDSWNKKSENVHKGRRYFWNDDYLKFLVEHIWKIKTPIDVIDFRCGDGYLGMKLINLLPLGSTYTGLDNEFFLNEAKSTFEKSQCHTEFIESDLYSFESDKKYDLAICHAGLRHMNKPIDMLEGMKLSVKKDALIVCVEVNREFENDGLFIDEINYEYLCTGFDFHQLWSKEFECEGRDYAIGMKLPFYMKQIGLRDIDVRVNDKALYVHPDLPNYQEIIEDITKINGWNMPFDISEKEKIVELFMNRGMDRFKAEAYFERHNILVDYFKNDNNTKSFLKVNGLIVSFGWT